MILFWQGVGNSMSWLVALTPPTTRGFDGASILGTGQRAGNACYNRGVFPAKIQGKIMPKLKTHKGASKRFKKTGTGLVVRNHAFGRHILTSKPHKRKKKLHQSVVADKADQPVLKRMIPY